MLQMLARPLLLSGACYAVTQGVGYLCTRPDLSDGRIPTIFENVRLACASMYEFVASDPEFREFSNIVFKNAWISVFAVALWIPDELSLSGYVLTGNIAGVPLSVRMFFSSYLYLALQIVVNDADLPRTVSWVLSGAISTLTEWLTPQAGTEETVRAMEAKMQLIGFLETGNLVTIPSYYNDLFPNKCLISGNAIRTIVVPIASVGFQGYEKTELVKWMREKPNEAPPGWPVDRLPLPLREEYFQGDAVRQQAFDHAITVEARRICVAT